MKYQEVLQMIKTADEARNSAIQQHRQAVTNGTAQPVYRPGDFRRMGSEAIRQTKQHWPDSVNAVRTFVRGVPQAASGTVVFGLNTLGDTLQRGHALYDAAVNRNDPAYRGQSVPQRLDTAVQRTRNGWTSKFNDAADAYRNYMQIGMDTIPGMAYTDDFAEKYPAAVATGERLGMIMGGLGMGQLAGALAKPTTAPTWLNSSMSKMPIPAQAAVKNGIRALTQTPKSWRSAGVKAFKSLPVVPKWMKDTVGNANTAYGVIKSTLKGAPAPMAYSTAYLASQTPKTPVQPAGQQPASLTASAIPRAVAFANNYTGSPWLTQPVL